MKFVPAMHTRDLETERGTLEDALRGGGLDFAASYVAVSELHSLIKTHPWIIRSKTISVLQGILKDPRFSCQTQAFFLYREAANTLASVIVLTSAEPEADQAMSALTSVLTTDAGDLHRACAEAMGCLPVSVRGPETSDETTQDIPQVKWQEVLERVGITTCNAPVPAVFGRCLAMVLDNGARMFVVKLASVQHTIRSICREAVWMEHLCSARYSFPVRFNIPVVVRIDGSRVFRLENMPARMPEEIHVHPDCCAMGFFAHKDYFAYPNDHRPERRPSMESFMEVMFRNAWLFARLTSLGIVHSAPIPLFHNRVQANRRADRGLYEWQRGGRLDRWLYSCRYPNFGPTGIRDFEHFIAFRGTCRELYTHIGTQILSLLLATGSYFRNKDITRIGLDGQGNPVDAQDLFDKSCFNELTKGIFLNYYQGFTGRKFNEQLPLNFDALTSRMIEEMGVDRHMQETLRVVDQREMTDKDFRDFLETRGYPVEEIRGFKKGLNDIIACTGPHLGGFNERISLPELIESVGTMSALCIAGRYWSEVF